MQYSKKILTNGIKLLIVPMPHLSSVTLTVWVKTGSRNETKQNNGISHFIEHMLFKGSSKRPTAKDISEVVDGIGGEFNASTSKDYTNYYVKCRKENLETAFDILSDMVINPVLSKEEIEREKGTIIEEIRMYEDTPMMKIGDTFEELIYSGSTLEMDIAGTEKTVKNMSKDDFLRYREEYYYTDNITISVVGGVSEDEAIKLSENYFKDMPKRKEQVSQNYVFNNLQNSPKIKLHNKKKEQTHIILGFLADGKNYKNKYAQTLLSAVLGSGMSSRLFLEVRERRGLAYSVRTSMDRYEDVGYMGTYAGLDTKKAVEAVKIILEEHLNIASGKNKVTDQELKKAKELLKGHLALALEDTRDVTSFFTDQALFSPEILVPSEVFKRIDQVKIEEVNEEAKRLFVPERLNLAIIGPYDDEGEFKKVCL
jgi:predicted Zn-dependent peptidase